MKKYFLPALRLPCFLALFLCLQDFVIPKTFLYADESLSCLQQEVIYAKQKHQEISAKMEAMQALMDSQQTFDLKEDAQPLTQEPDKKDASENQADLKSEPSKELPKERSEERRVGKEC